MAATPTSFLVYYLIQLSYHLAKIISATADQLLGSKTVRASQKGQPPKKIIDFGGDSTGFKSWI